MAEIDYGIKYKPLLNTMSECGDVGLVKRFNGYVIAMLVDGLGHGEKARQAAMLAIEYVDKNCTMNLKEITINIHKLLVGTRGAVAAICLLDLNKGQLKYIGIGNISVRIIGDTQRRLVSQDGVLGHSIPTPRENETDFHKKQVLIMYSDGVKDHFEIGDHLIRNNLPAQQIADEIVSRYKKINDDSSCVVLQYF
jgi:serine phosphatase RsbU (regulator of sigma subunit)